MKAYLYKVEVSDGALDFSHGFKYKIWEIWIPEYEICVNEKGGIFESDKQRSEENMEEIEVDFLEISYCKMFTAFQKLAEAIVNKIFRLEKHQNNV